MKHIMVVFGLLAFAGITGLGRFAAAGEECPPVGGLNFLCGPIAAEDLVRMPGTHWIIGSGMSEKGGPGRLHLIDADKKTWEILYPGATPQNEFDAKSYASCPGAPDARTFGAHGIAIHDEGSRRATLLAVNHGREAVEVFKLDATGAKPAIRWIGCVPMDKNVSLNSVAFLPGGGFVATKFYDPTSKESFGAIMAHKLTGGVLKWQRGSGTQPVPGTDLSGANGIEVSRDKVETAITAIQKQMRTDDHFYSHLYVDETVIVIFKDKVFRVTPHISSWTEIKKYGMELGIPEAQLDFWPNRFQDEPHYFN